jgi:hypothetical protein
MSHVLHAIVGPNATIAEFASRWWRARRINLPQDFALVPLTAALHDDIVELADVQASDAYPGFERLCANVAMILLETSKVGPVGYIETDFFGGVGVQHAVAWRGGKLLLGPFHSQTAWTAAGAQTESASQRAINRVLTALGVWTHGAADPFEMLALSKFRNTESMAAPTS